MPVTARDCRDRGGVHLALRAWLMEAQRTRRPLLVTTCIHAPIREQRSGEKYGARNQPPVTLLPITHQLSAPATDLRVACSESPAPSRLLRVACSESPAPSRLLRVAFSESPEHRHDMTQETRSRWLPPSQGRRNRRRRRRPTTWTDAQATTWTDRPGGDDQDRTRLPPS